MSHVFFAFAAFNVPNCKISDVFVNIVQRLITIVLILIFFNISSVHFVFFHLFVSTVNKILLRFSNIELIETEFCNVFTYLLYLN